MFLPSGRSPYVHKNSEKKKANPPFKTTTEASSDCPQPGPGCFGPWSILVEQLRSAGLNAVPQGMQEEMFRQATG